MMFAFLLIFSPVAQFVEPIYEEIRLSDDLTLRAEYVAEGQLAPREGMLLTVEDFVIISSELDFAGDACVGRIDAINRANKDQLQGVITRCDEQYALYTTELDRAHLELNVLHKELAHSRFWSSVYKWTAISVGSVLLGTSAYLILAQ
jgi:hypothetical protein